MNPFEPWLSTYQGDVVPERPWWCLVVDGRGRWSYRRVDGQGAWSGRFGDRVEQSSIDAVMVRIDTENPLPVPPILASQVWTTPRGEQILLTSVEPGWTVNDTTIANYSAIECCLVSGPFAPWAPPGWKP